MKSKKQKSSIEERKMLIQYVLAIDVAKSKSMVALISSSGEVLIEPYEINHSIIDFNNLFNRINYLKLDSISVIMESTGIYHRPIERFLMEKGFDVYTINPLYSKISKKSLRKTKTDKLDCLSLSELYFNNEFRKNIKPNSFYLNLNALSRQYFSLIEISINLKNRYKELIYLCFPEYEQIFKGNGIYSEFAMKFIQKYPHSDYIKNIKTETLEKYLKKINFRYFKHKSNIIKNLSINSYPAESRNSEFTSNLKQIAKLIDVIDYEINITKNKIIDYGKNSKYFEKINSIFGIGDFSASLIIAELGDINRFNNIKQLTAYCGLDPSIRQSGKSININGPISKAGNKYMRHILFTTVFNIVRLSSKCHIENDIEIYYRKKRNEGKHHYVATIACSTKLLRQILALCKQLDK